MPRTNRISRTASNLRALSTLTNRLRIRTRQLHSRIRSCLPENDVLNVPFPSCDFGTGLTTASPLPPTNRLTGARPGIPGITSRNTGARTTAPCSRTVGGRAAANSLSSNRQKGTKSKSSSKKKQQLLPPSKVEKRKRRNIRLGNCPVCWDDLTDTPLASTKCGHVFCLNCMQRRPRIRRCPTCRGNLYGPAAFHPLYLDFEKCSEPDDEIEDNDKDNVTINDEQNNVNENNHTDVNAGHVIS